MREELLKLAERVEGLSGPCEETDALIRCALYAPQGAYVEQSRINGAWCVYDGTKTQDGRARLFEHWPSRDAKCAPFTRSLDAAMSLVSAGMGVGVWRLSDDMGGATAEVWEFDLDSPDCPELYHVLGGYAVTPALALTAAALRALAEQQP